MKSIKNISIMVLSGAYNLGDEMILLSEIDFFQKKYPHAEITVFTYDEKSFLGEKKNIKFLSYFPNNFRRHLWRNIVFFWRTIVEVWRTNILVIGWWGIFFDNENNVSFKKNIFEWKLRLFFARLFCKKVIFFGISIEVKQQNNQQKLKKIFSQQDIIFPRDEKSMKIINDLWFQWILLYDAVFLQNIKTQLRQTSPKIIGISIRDWFLKENDIGELKKIVDILSNEKFEIIFLSHSLSQDESHNDAIFVEKIFGKKYKITKTLQETIEYYNIIDIMISMRLHSTILSAQRGIPVIMLPYGPKTFSLAEILSLQEWTMDMNNFSAEIFYKKIMLLCDNYKKEQEKISASYQEIHIKFLQKIEKLDIL